MRRSEALHIFGFPETIQNPDLKELTRRFRKLAREKHPDKGGDSEEFLRIKKAYDILKGDENPDNNIRGPPSKMDEMFESVFTGFNKMFSKFRGEEPPKLIKKRMRLNVSDLFNGTVRELEIQKTRPCEECMGTGTGSKIKCADCQGLGYLEIKRRTPKGIIVQTNECKTCIGRGGIGVGANKPCIKCNGFRKIYYKIKKGVDIPKAIPHNSRINIIEGVDNPIEIIIQHPNQRDDDWKSWRLNPSTRNLEKVLYISLEDSLLGGSYSIEHPGGGVIDIKIEPGTQPGHRIIKKDRGLPACPDTKMPPSSAIIEIHIKIPIIPEEHRENIKRFFEIIRKSGAIEPPTPDNSRFFNIYSEEKDEIEEESEEENIREPNMER
jgi:molecular chaperone DnaJ